MTTENTTCPVCGTENWCGCLGTAEKLAHSTIEALGITSYVHLGGLAHVIAGGRKFVAEYIDSRWRNIPRVARLYVEVR